MSFLFLKGEILLKKLAKYLKPYKFKIFLTLLFTFINVLSTMYLPSLMSKIVNEGVIHGETSVIMKYGIYMIFVTFIGGLVMIGAAYLSSEIATNVGRQIRRDVFTKVERYTLDQVNHFGVATLMTRTTTDINQLQDLLIMGLRMMARSPLMFIGGVIMAVQASPRLSMTLLIALPVIALFIIAVGKKGMPLFKIVQKKVDKLNRVVRENVTGIRVIRAFDKQEYEMQRFEEANRDLRDTNLKINKIMSFLFPGIFFILDAIIILVIYFATSQIDAGLMEVGDLMAFVQYITMILFSIIMLSMIFVMVPRAQVSANRVNEVLEMDDKTKERAGTKKVPENMCSLEFDDVSFKYDNAENCTLENLNFKVKAGETLAIMGGTGSGKSTIANLIVRFFDVSKGSIKLCGEDIRELDLHDLRKHIGLVPQTAVLFSGTIRDNIKKGKKDATDEEIIEALKIAQAWDFVSGLKDGLDSLVAQGGTNFSGGQKQRLSIARAIVRKPKIYIFDDSFSALDYKTDKVLRNELNKIKGDSIFIIVAQRVSTVMDADQIIVLEDGEIDGIGVHEQLLKISNVYKETYESQINKEGI